VRVTLGGTYLLQSEAKVHQAKETTEKEYEIRKKKDRGKSSKGRAQKTIRAKRRFDRPAEEQGSKIRNRGVRETKRIRR